MSRGRGSGGYALAWGKLAKVFRDEIDERQPAWREVIATAARQGVPCLAMGDSLGYFVLRSRLVRAARIVVELLARRRRRRDLRLPSVHRLLRRREIGRGAAVRQRRVVVLRLG